MSTNSSPLPSCFRPTIADEHHPTAAPSPPPPPTTDSTNLTTCLYYTHLGVFSLTWSRTLFGRSLHLHLQDQQHQSHHIAAASPPSSPPSSSTLSFHLHLKPLVFWKKHGSKKLSNEKTTAQVFWDLSRAKFGSGSEPGSGFYLAVVVDGEMSLLVGDLVTEAYSKTKAQKPKRAQFLFSRREHVFGNRVYSTTARVGGETRDISIECNVNGDGRLCFGIDRKKIMMVKRLKWKFRGNERVEVDGVPVNISWDVYNWMPFEDLNNKDGPGVFMFKFEKLGFEEEKIMGECYNELESFNSFGMNDIELRKMRKSMLRSSRSSSSSSISSSASSSSGSSVMEWASSEESKLCGPIGFSLVVYAWKR